MAEEYLWRGSELLPVWVLLLGVTHLALQFRHTFNKLGLRCFWKLRVDALA